MESSLTRLHQVGKCVCTLKLTRENAWFVKRRKVVMAEEMPEGVFCAEEISQDPPPGI